MNRNIPRVTTRNSPAVTPSTALDIVSTVPSMVIAQTEAITGDHIRDNSYESGEMTKECVLNLSPAGHERAT